MAEFCKSQFRPGHLQVLEWFFSNTSSWTASRGYDFSDIHAVNPRFVALQGVSNVASAKAIWPAINSPLNVLVLALLHCEVLA